MNRNMQAQNEFQLLTGSSEEGRRKGWKLVVGQQFIPAVSSKCWHLLSRHLAFCGLYKRDELQSAFTMKDSMMIQKEKYQVWQRSESLVELLFNRFRFGAETKGSCQRVRRGQRYEFNNGKYTQCIQSILVEVLALY